jgi:ABC-2 type transport system ATP-binding protein
MAQDLAIDLTGVYKTYRSLRGRRTPALRGISMRVHRGEIFGLLGPNGAGKSTLVKILMTVIHPTRCEGTLLSQRVGHKPTLGRVGYLPEHHSFPGYLNAAQVLDHFGAMAGVPRRDRRQRTGRLLELVGMSAWAKRPLRSYSKGMRQRVGIAQALINEPELVLLDEPTDGVDPVGRRDIRGMIEQIRARGTTVMINSHLLSELEQLCDRVAILVKGVVASQGTLDELTAGQRGYEVVLADEAPPLTDRLPTGEPVRTDGRTLRIGTEDPGKIQPLLDGLRRGGSVIAEVRPVRPSLEDLFMQAVTDPDTGRVLTPGAAEKGGPA